MKKFTRKEFLDLSVMSAMSLPLLTESVTREHFNARKKYIDNLGFQVYGLRELLIKDAPNLFKALALAGIRNIEFFDPSTLNKYVPIVNDCGMIPLSTHFMPGYITGNWETARKMKMAPPDNYHCENIIDDCNKFNIKYMGVAILLPEDRSTLDDYKKFAEKANQYGEKSKAAGIQLYYHSHSFEFETIQGTKPYDEMLKIFDRKLVKLELDSFWLTLGNQDPVLWMRKVIDRLLFLHLKDLKKGAQLGKYTTSIPDDYYTELGTGMIDYKPILTEAKKLGVKYVLLDQDKTQMSDKITSVQKSIDHLRMLNI